MNEEILNRILKKLAIINIPLYFINIFLLVLLGNGILSSIFFSIVVLFVETIFIGIYSFVLLISSREIVFTNTESKRKIMRILSIFSYLPELTFMFRPKLEDLSQIPEFNQMFPESKKLTNLYSKYLGDGILFDTEGFMNDLNKLKQNKDFSELCAGIQTIYESDDFKKSNHKKEIYIEKFNEKALIFFYNTEFKIKLNHKELVKNYPNYSDKLQEEFALNSDLFLEEDRKDYTYIGEYTKFFDIVFTNLDNSKKELGFKALATIMSNKSKFNKINSVDDFDKSLEKLRQ